MSFFGKLFGSDEALATVVDTASGLLDEAFYTKEEKAADRAAARTEAQGMVIKWLEASTGSRLARRVIAFMITGTWLFMKLLGVFVSMAAVWVEALSAAKLEATAVIANASAAEMTGAVMLILGFYFAAPYMGELAKGALQRFGKQ